MPGQVRGGASVNPRLFNFHFSALFLSICFFEKNKLLELLELLISLHSLCIHYASIVHPLCILGLLGFTWPQTVGKYRMDTITIP